MVLSLPFVRAAIDSACDALSRSLSKWASVAANFRISRSIYTREEIKLNTYNQQNYLLLNKLTVP